MLMNLESWPLQCVRPTLSQLKARTVTNEAGCWIWQGAKHPAGYGLIKVSQQMHRCHRLAYEIANGEVPHGNFVLHRCDNPACINPDHLFVGTHSDNMRDMHAKGRGRHKLTFDEIEEIRRLRRTGLYLKEIANRFSISKSQVANVANNYSWSHN